MFSRKQFLQILIPIVCFTIIILYRSSITDLNLNAIVTLKTIKYYENYVFMLNRNVIQYSSYLISDKSINTLKIQSIIHVNYQYISNSTNIFACKIKSIKTNYTAVFRASEVIELAEPESKKITCKIQLMENIDLNELVIAVVRKGDFGDSKPSFPKYMLNFQIPKIINVLKNKIPQVGLCVQFVYNKPEMFESWLKIQNDIGIAEIVLHDSTDDRSLNNYVDSKYVEIRPYNINYTDICRKDLLNFNDQDSLNIYLKTCNIFFDREFADKYALRGKHDHMSSNDCYITMSQKYEFVALYDLDEVIYTRSLNSQNMTLVESCKNSSSICQLKPFSMKIYDYLNKLIENEEDKNKLSAIVFDHAFYLLSYDMEIKLMDNLKNFILNGTQKYPSKIFLEYKSQLVHEFIIEKTDLDYIKNLINLHDTLSCLYKDSIDNITTINHDLKRFLYYVTELDERFPKSIHYTNNVQAVFTHFPLVATPDSVEFVPNYINGHVLSHYRKEMPDSYEKVFKGTIRKLNVDFEYSLYLLKNYTNLCKL
jgi:hypothetical protein